MSAEGHEGFLAALAVDALDITIPLESVAPEQVPALAHAGNPQTGAVALGTFADREVGVWEMTVGAMTDVEVDELCIIIAGAGELHRTLDGKTVVQQLRPGSVVQLRNGEETLWVVTGNVRKVYLA